MKRLAIATLCLATAGAAHAQCPAVSSAALGAVIARHGGIDSPAIAPICSRVQREGFAFLVTGDYGVGNGGAFAWANVLLEDPGVGSASSSHFAASTQHSKVATAQEAERLFFQAVSVAIRDMKYQDAIVKLRQSTANFSPPKSKPSVARKGSAGGA
jgi:hypothetical protein